MDTPIWPEKYPNYYVNNLKNLFMSSSSTQKRSFKVITGHLPENDSEICLSTYQYYLFSLFGYQNSGNEIPAESITSYHSLIGKKLNFRTLYDAAKFEFSICGFVDTGFKESNYTNLFNALTGREKL